MESALSHKLHIKRDDKCNTDGGDDFVELKEGIHLDFLTIVLPTSIFVLKYHLQDLHFCFWTYIITSGTYMILYQNFRALAPARKNVHFAHILLLLTLNIMIVTTTSNRKYLPPHGVEMFVPPISFVWEMFR